MIAHNKRQRGAMRARSSRVTVTLYYKKDKKSIRISLFHKIYDNAYPPIFLFLFLIYGCLFSYYQFDNNEEIMQCKTDSYCHYEVEYDCKRKGKNKHEYVAY